MRKIHLGSGSTAHIRMTNTVEPTKEFEERVWRDSELERTDSMLQPDRPNYQEILNYREALRNYPNHVDFPENERPVL